MASGYRSGAGIAAASSLALLAADAGAGAIAATPASAPQPIIVQLRLPPSTPCASAEISAACGAASAFGPAPGIPAKPNDV